MLRQCLAQFCFGIDFITKAFFSQLSQVAVSIILEHISDKIGTGQLSC